MKKIRMVKQTEKDTCGPACLAMIIGSTEQKMKAVLKENNRFHRGIETEDVKWILKKYGVCFGSFTRDGYWKMEKKALLTYAYNHYTVHMHYILWANGRYYDPARGIIDEIFEPLTATRWQKIVGYIPIYD